MPDTLTLDITGGRDLWRRLAPQNARRLLDAGDEADAKEDRQRCRRKEDRSKKENRNFCLLLFLLYFYDDSIGRYRTGGVNPDGSGPLVSDQAVKQAVNTFADKAANQMGAIASRLVDGSIGLPEFATAMTQKVNAAHTAAYAAGAGGIARLTGHTLAKAQDAVGFHLAKLDGFIADVRRGGIDGEAIVNRSRLYGVSVPTTQENAKSFFFRGLADTGVAIEERNVLGDAEHCRPDPKQGTEGCLELAELGWVARGTISLPGQRTCKMNCRCRMEYRIAAN